MRRSVSSGAHDQASRGAQDSLPPTESVPSEADVDPRRSPNRVLTVRSVLALQQTAGNVAVARMLSQAPARVLQRGDPTAGDPPSASQALRLGGRLIETYEDAAFEIEGWCLDLEDEVDALTDHEIEVPEILQITHREGLDLADVLDGGGLEPLDDENAVELQAWYASYVKAVNAGRSAQAIESAARANAAAARLEKLNAKLKQLEIALRDEQRKRLRDGDEDGLLATADAIATIVDTALITKKAVDPTLDVANRLQLFAGTGGTASSPINLSGKIGSVYDALNKLNGLVAKLQLVTTAIGLVTGDKTDAEGGREAIDAMVTVVSAGGTLLDASVGFTIFSNVYLGPMTAACLSGLAKLENLVSENRNREWIEAGRPEYVVWSVEIGGRPMFDFMLALMRARSARDVPAPLQAVDECLVSLEDEFNAGVGSAGGAMPTEGSWFWKDTDKGEINQWAFQNRKDLWGMLYGSAAVPTGGAL